MYFTTFSEDNTEQIGILNREKTRVLNLKVIESFKDFNDMLNLIQGWDYKFEDILNKVLDDSKLWEEESININEIKLIAPIPRLSRNVICLGLNYRQHVKESQSALALDIDLPKHPVYFSKLPSKATGYGEPINSHPEITKEVDYEVELAVIIGKTGTNIKPEEVEDHIFGYTILNDVSARDLQRDHIQWFKGKGLDTFTVIGPWITYKKLIPFPVELEVYSKVNGEVRQHANTKDFIFDIPYIVSQLSRGVTLQAGDIIATGTPAGVGMGMKPPQYLKAGDVVECYIEKIGTLSNPVI